MDKGQYQEVIGICFVSRYDCHRDLTRVGRRQRHVLIGVKPDIKGVKDASILSRVIKNYGLDRTKQMIDTFLNSDDSFISSSGWTLGVFSFVINKLLLNCKPITKTGKALKTIADWGNNVDEKSVSDGDSDVIDLQP